MPSYEAHMRKYNENKKLLEEKLPLKNNEYNNWIVTVSFYAALHLVESSMAEDDIHFKDHSARNKNVMIYDKLKSVSSSYKILYTKSIMARYDSNFVNTKQCRFVLDCLKKIEDELLVENSNT